MLALGILASIFHLGHPLGAVRSFSNLESAWLSREILGLSLFGVTVAAIYFAAMAGTTRGWLIKLGAVLGATALFATSMTYAAPPSLPAIHNVLPLLFFGLTAIILGTAIGAYFAGPDKQELLFRILVNALVVSLTLNLAIPWIWLSGGSVMAQTGTNYLQSPLYWTQIIVGLIVPLVILWRMRRIPIWLPVLLIIGEFAGRIAFFALTASTVGNLGRLY